MILNCHNENFPNVKGLYNNFAKFHSVKNNHVNSTSSNCNNFFFVKCLLELQTDKNEDITCSHDGGKGGQAFPTRVSATPAMVLGSVNQVKVAVAKHRHGRQSSLLRVAVHAFDHQHFVGQCVVLVCLPV